MDSPRSRLDGQIWCADCQTYHPADMHTTPSKIHTCGCNKKCGSKNTGIQKVLDNWQKQLDVLNSIKNWNAITKDIVEAEIEILQKCYDDINAALQNQ